MREELSRFGKGILRKGKQLVGVYDRERLETLLYETNISASLAFKHLRYIDYFLRMKDKIEKNPERVKKVIQKWEKEYDEFRGKYLDATEIPESELSVAEKKLKQEYFDRMMKASDVVEELKHLKKWSGNLQYLAKRVSRYLNFRKDTEPYEQQKEKIEELEIVDKSPDLKGKILSLEKNIIEIKELEQKIFAHNPLLLTLLPKEFRKKFEKKSNM